MNLFEEDPSENLLPNDGVVNYFGKILSNEAATNYYEKLLQGIEWKNDEAVIYGKHIITARKVIRHG